MVEVYTLNAELLQKVARIPDEFREKGPPGNDKDPTRLCNKWKGALKEDKDLFATLMNSNQKLTAKQFLENHNSFRIYTKTAVQCAIGNWRQKYKKELEARAKGKFNFNAWHFAWLTCLTKLFVAGPSYCSGKWLRGGLGEQEHRQEEVGRRSGLSCNVQNEPRW